MNNIYKVIWSKAKNCYVVASEIARSHTKSASGSEKIGGVTRRSLLASLMALSLLCGGLGVASAADSTVHVDASTMPGNATEVYTTTGVNTLLADYGKKSDVENNKNSITTMNTTITTQGQSIATNVANIANNTKAIEKKIDTEAADLKYATKEALADKADQTTVTALDGRVGDVEGKVTTLETKVGDATGGLVKDVADLKAQGTSLNNELGNKANQTDLDEANKKIATNKDNITALQTKTTQISYADGDGTNISGVTIKDGNIIGNGNSAITQLANVETDKIKTDSINGKSLTGTNVATEKNVKDVADAVKAENDARTEADTALEGKINDEKTARENKDNELEGKITKNTQDIAKLDENGVKYDTAVKDTITLKGPDSTKITNLKDADLSDSSTDAVTGKQLNKTNEDLKTEAQTRKGMDTLLSDRADALEKNTGGITRNDAKDETYIEKNVTVDNQGNITAKGKVTANGAVNAGSLNVTDASHLKGDVIMDNTLTVKGDTSLNNTDVGGALTVTGESSLKNTTVGGTLTAEKDATFEKNVTVEKDLTVNGKLNVDKISLKNDELKNGKKHDSATTITADEISNLAKVTEQGNTTESQFTHNEKGTFNYAKDGDSTDWTETRSDVTANGVSNTMKDSAGNKHTYSQTATESKEQIVNGDKSNFEKKTAEGNTISIKDKDAAGNDKSLTNKQTVDGEKTSVTNKDSSSTINQGADQIRYNVTSKDENKTSSSIEVKADGITNTSKDGTITNTAKNVTNEGTKSVTNKVGANEVKVSTDGVDIKAEDGKKITESVGTASRVVENDKITDEAGDSTVTTEKGKGTTFGKAGSTDTTNIYGDSIKTGTINAKDTTTDKLTAGAAVGADGGRLTVDAKDGVQGSYKFGDYTSRSYILANTLKSGVDNGKEPIDADFVGSRTDHYMVGDKAKLDETVKDADGSNVTQKTSTGTVTTITDGTGTTTTKTEQGTKDITNTAKDGTITNDAKDIVNNAKNTITNTAGTSITNQVKDSIVTTDANGTTFENKTAAVSDGGTTTTKINGNHINTGRVDANELGVSDKDDQGNTAGLSVKAGEGNKGGIKGYATDKDGNKTYTKVTATENSFQVQDKDGNIKNHQVNTKDKSENTIKNGDKTNIVTSTADGTTFNNSEAAAPVTGASGAGTHLNTTIKGNTITTGKVTMDYADVMKDLGVKGNTTLGEAGKDTTLTVNSKATFNNGLTVTNGETKLKNTTIEGTLNVFENATFQKDVTANSFSVNGKTYIDSDGLNANNQVIRNVADGSISEGSKDAVNGGQLYTVKNDLEGKVNKVGANAAAMANLHPMEFDPDSKWNIAAAIGNYGSETAAALGAFYRPNDDVMVNLSTAFGTGENMVGGGVSVRLGKSGNKLSREESNALKDQVNDLTARMDALLSVLNPNMSKDFPDVPENHWAYEAVSRLAGNDIVQGYPDGEFHGERTMTRYEMAEIIYNALSRGAEAEKELVEEFKPELQAMAASEKATAERAEG